MKRVIVFVLIIFRYKLILERKVCSIGYAGMDPALTKWINNIKFKYLPSLLYNRKSINYLLSKPPIRNIPQQLPPPLPGNPTLVTLKAMLAC